MTGAALPALALLLAGCASLPPSETIRATPLRGQTHAQMLRDRDDCNGDAARYAPCMVARNYEVEVDVPIPVLVFNGEQRLSRIAYLIAIEPGYAATADMVLAIIQACADEAGTTAAREGYRHVDAGTAASGWLATPITMLAYAANEATFQKIVDRTFPVCMARRHFSVRRPEPPPPPAKW